VYHAEARRPFARHFLALRQSGMSEEELYREYRSLIPPVTDETHAESWFRDQVLHPHETAHTLEELLPTLTACGMSLVSTSINRFAPFASEDELFAHERRLADYGAAMLRQGRFFPGFFTFLCRKAG
jgi:hypothetical protein